MLSKFHSTDCIVSINGSQRMFKWTVRYFSNDILAKTLAKTFTKALTKKLCDRPFALKNYVAKFDHIAMKMIKAFMSLCNLCSLKSQSKHWTYLPHHIQLNGRAMAYFWKKATKGKYGTEKWFRRKYFCLFDLSQIWLLHSSIDFLSLPGLPDSDR